MGISGGYCILAVVIWNLAVDILLVVNIACGYSDIGGGYIADGEYWPWIFKYRRGDVFLVVLCCWWILMRNISGGILLVPVGEVY